VVLSLVPLALGHEHLTTAFFDSADNTRVLNGRSKVLGEAEDRLHSALLLKFDAHLDFESENFEQHASLLDVEELLAAEVAVASSCGLGRQASCFKFEEHLLERVKQFAVEVRPGQTQTRREP